MSTHCPGCDQSHLPNDESEGVKAALTLVAEYIAKNAQQQVRIAQQQAQIECLKEAFRAAAAYAQAALDDTDVMSEEARERWLADLQELSKVLKR